MDDPDYIIINPLQIVLFIPELKLDKKIEKNKNKLLKYMIKQINHKLILVDV